MAVKQARRGKFGQMPVVQADLSSTLTSIAHEMTDQEDSNIMDAWRNGGDYNGAPVTDSQVLAYWQARMANLDKSDPLYDKYQEQYQQLQYGIEQSKNDLLHVQGKMSDSAYAQFYLNWAKKVPADSEFYRTLQKDAAQLLQTSHANGAAAAAKAKVNSYNSFYATQAGAINLGNTLNQAIADEGAAHGLSVSDNGDQLLQYLNQDYDAHPEQYRLLHDALMAANPSFNAEPPSPGALFSHSFVANALQAAGTAYSTVATRANKDGYTDNYIAAAKGQSTMNLSGHEMGVWPTNQTYDTALQAFNKVWTDPNTTYADRLAAAQGFSKVCQTLAGDQTLDSAAVASLTADAARLVGGNAGDVPSYADMIGVPKTRAMPADIAITATLVQQQQLMDANPGAYIYAPSDGQGNYSATGAIGVIPVSQKPDGAEAVSIPSLTDGTPRLVYVPVTIVYADNPNSPTGAPIPVGKELTYQKGGQTVTLYGSQDQDGVATWTSSSPWATNVAQRLASDGSIHLTPPARDPVATAAALDSTYAQYGLNVSGLLKQADYNTTGGTVEGHIYNGTTVVSKVSVSVKDGIFTTTKTDYNSAGATVSSTTSQTGGYGSDTSVEQQVTSPYIWMKGKIGASDTPLSASAQQLSTSQQSSLVQNPSFQAAYLAGVEHAFGTNDVNDPRVQQAWSGFTASMGAPATKVPASATSRADLSYPGQAATPSTTPSSIINSPTSIKVPTIPAGYVTVPARAGSGVDGPKSINVSQAHIDSYAQGSFLATLAPVKTAAPTAPVIPVAPTPTYTPPPVTAPTPTPTAAPAATPTAAPSAASVWGSKVQRV